MLIQAFKTCNVCNRSWQDRSDLVSDINLQLIGYQANIVNVEKGLFLFNHSCGGTLSIPAAAFKDLYMGPVYTKHEHGGDNCPGYCLYKNNLRPCPAECDCAYVREILQHLKVAMPGNQIEKSISSCNAPEPLL